MLMRPSAKIAPPDARSRKAMGRRGRNIEILAKAIGRAGARDLTYLEEVSFAQPVHFFVSRIFHFQSASSSKSFATSLET